MRGCIAYVRFVLFGFTSVVFVLLNASREVVFVCVCLCVYSVNVQGTTSLNGAHPLHFRKALNTYIYQSVWPTFMDYMGTMMLLLGGI